MNKKSAIALSLCAGLLLLQGVAADTGDRVIREHTFSLDEINEIDLHAGVGSLKIVPAKGKEMRLILDIEGQDHGWFHHRRDVSDVDLESHVRGSRLVLDQTDQDTKTEWTVEMPVVARTNIHMGVGQIDAEFGNTELRVEMGVGDVDVDMPAAGAGRIDMHVGVGDASVRGAHNVDHRHSFVSHSLEADGEGDNDVRIKVGVGDADLRLL